jgi:hypothetical protein
MLFLYSLAGTTPELQYLSAGIGDISSIILCLIVLFGLSWARVSKQLLPATAHWQKQFANRSFSSKEFYEKVTALIKEKKYPDTRILKVTHPEGGYLSANRQYLRIQRDLLVFDICAAPFGRDYFFSWWQSRFPTPREVTLRILPFLGRTTLRNGRSHSYHEADTEEMFKLSIEQCVSALIEEMTRETGLRDILESEQLINKETVTS